MKLTPQVLTALTLPPGKTDALFFDGEVPGLALRLRAGGTRAWVFQYRLGSKQTPSEPRLGKRHTACTKRASSRPSFTRRSSSARTRSAPRARPARGRTRRSAPCCRCFSRARKSAFDRAPTWRSSVISKLTPSACTRCRWPASPAETSLQCSPRQPPDCPALRPTGCAPACRRVSAGAIREGLLEIKPGSMDRAPRGGCAKSAALRRRAASRYGSALRDDAYSDIVQAYWF